MAILDNRFNKGTLPYELIIQSNTLINCFGKYDISKKVEMKNLKVVINFDELESVEGCVREFSITYFTN